MSSTLCHTARPLTIAVMLLVAGCNFAPEGDEPMEAPPEYRAWFAATEACSGLSGRFERIVWHVVEGESFDCPSGKCVGRWNNNHHIYIASAYRNHELVVRHEILHDLIGRPGHPDPPFGDGCPLTWESWRAQAGPDGAADGRLAATPPLHID